MFFKKNGNPEEGELVVCTIKRILPHAAFVDLDEYENKEAMLHISEVSSKWIKNIKDVISEGKKVVCKVLQVNKEKGYIDVSLKRVSNAETQRKMNEIKLEVKIEKLIEAIAKKFNEDPNKALSTVGKELVKSYGSLAGFYDYVKDKGVEVINTLVIPDNWKEALKSEISEQIKCQRVLIKKELNITSFSSNGINDMKEVIELLIQNLEKLGATCIKVRYVSAPKYSLEYTSQNFKQGEQFLKKASSEVMNAIKKSDIIFSISDN